MTPDKDNVPSQFEPLKDAIIAQHNRINQYVTTHQNLPRFNISATIAAIKLFMLERQLTEFADATRKFGYELSQAILKRQHQTVKEIIKGGIKDYEKRYK